MSTAAGSTNSIIDVAASSACATRMADCFRTDAFLVQ